MLVWRGLEKEDIIALQALHSRFWVNGEKKIESKLYIPQESEVSEDC
jgi:hypothetical protein